MFGCLFSTSERSYHNKSSWCSSMPISNDYQMPWRQNLRTKWTIEVHNSFAIFWKCVWLLCVCVSARTSSECLSLSDICRCYKRRKGLRVPCLCAFVCVRFVLWAQTQLISRPHRPKIKKSIFNCYFQKFQMCIILLSRVSRHCMYEYVPCRWCLIYLYLATYWVTVGRGTLHSAHTNIMTKTAHLELK